MKSRKVTPSKIAAYLILIIHLVIVIMPIYMMIVTSFKTNKEIFKSPLAIPSSFNLAGYEKVLKLNDFGRFYANSFIVTVAAILIFVIAGLLAAYAIARLKFRGSNGFYVYFLLLMMLLLKVLYFVILKPIMMEIIIFQLRQ